MTATSSQVAERYGTPHLNAKSSSPGLTERGFEKINTLGMMHEDMRFGAESVGGQEELARKYRFIGPVDVISLTRSVHREEVRKAPAGTNMPSEQLAMT